MKTLPDIRSWSIVERLLRGCLPFMLIVLIGCGTVVPNARTDLLKFLEPGRTTRQDVLYNLGQPSASFEQEKIFTYRVGKDVNDAYFIVSPKQPRSWQTVQYSLVLIFNAEGVLRKENLVPVQ